jgi:hypothetical protein
MDVDVEFVVSDDEGYMQSNVKDDSYLNICCTHDHKETSGAVQPEVVRAISAALDFIYMAQYYQGHSEDTLNLMDKALECFHQHKSIFEKLSIHDKFNIPKIHSMQHYTQMIRELGTADGYNTECPERLHIDYAKSAYRASNKKNYLTQMTTYHQRQDAIDKISKYLFWRLGQ